MNKETESLDVRLLKVYDQLSATDRRLADVVIANKKDLLAYSATELAGLAGASKASAARFFRRLGYSGFSDFRQHIRAQVPQQSPLSRIGRAPVRQSESARLQTHVQNDVVRLNSLLGGLTEEVLEQALEWLVQARRVWIVGYRNGCMTAFYASALLSQVRHDVNLLNELSGREAEFLADLNDKDLLLAVDFRRRTSRLPRIVAAARSAGTRVLLLTDTPLSALASQAAAILHCPNQTEQVFDSYVSAVSLMNYLATSMAARTPRQARARMSRIERLHAALGDLETDS
ncbi:MAG: MurR/RpiR family transcriptional regulator [Polaromonas sp.]|jgi:DNA-binding MurR/RpiR family transcriptional regulator|nr:MurR/RpiR family transcriptional regulator [Polaromonas sp.]